MNPYSVLQLDETATDEEIRQRHRFLSKTFHPDKQSPEHYDIANQYFYKVNMAYKAIETPLRRFIFREFGEAGILLLDEFKQEFFVYEDAIQDPEVQQKVRELIFHCHFHYKSDHEEEMTNTECMSSISALHLQKSRRFYGKSLGHIALFSTSGPSVRGIHNVLMMQVENMTDKPAVVTFKTVNTAHYKDILITNEMRIGNDFSTELTLSKPLTPYATLSISPLIYAGDQWHTPRISISSAVSKRVHLEVATDGSTSSIELVRRTENSAVRVKYANFGNMSEVSMAYEHSLDSDTSLTFGLTVTTAHEQNGLQLGLQHFYGLKFDLGSGNLLQLKSMTGRYNYLQVKMTSGKYAMRCPIFAQNVQLLHFEVGKLVAIVSIYAICRIIKQKNNKMILRKERLLRKNQSRLEEDRTKINTLINDLNSKAQMARRFELATGGLVILKALFGSEGSIKGFRNKYDNYQVRPQATLSYLNSLVNMDRQQLAQPQNQIYDITDMLQSYVVGARIIGFQPKLMNPCLDSREAPVLYIRYCLRGQSRSVIVSRFPLNLGKTRQKSRNIFNRLISWFRINFV